MQSIFSIRSPLWQIVSSIAMFIVLGLITYTEQNPNHSPIVTVMILLIGLFAFGAIFIFAGLARKYNKTHKHGKLNIWGFSPAELLQEDEGMRMFTGRATQRVYAYHAWALPATAIFITFTQGSVYVTLLALAVLTVGHYITYWRAIWPALQDA